MMMCSRCKKRPAVVFISTMNGSEQRNEGLCLKCASELNVPQVKEYLDHFGLSEKDLEEDIDALFGLNGDGDEDEMMADEDNEEESVDSFKKGGAGTMPPFMRSFFDSVSSDDSRPSNSDNIQKKNERADNKAEKSNKKRKRGNFL